MKELRYTLLSDGSSDQALQPILDWLLHKYFLGYAVQAAWADFARLPRPPKTLSDRINIALKLYPCDILFVHRDAEKVAPAKRVAEIKSALRKSADSLTSICVVPVRMQEAWLLFDEAAIRRAAGNPGGKVPLDLPSPAKLEALPDPKQVLHELLRAASGKQGRRLKMFKISKAAFRVTSFIEDFSPLRALLAFKDLEEQIKKTVVLRA